MADPSVDADVSLDLGWYIGGPKDELTENLNLLFMAIYRSLNKELLFVGGSAGG